MEIRADLVVPLWLFVCRNTNKVGAAESEMSKETNREETWTNREECSFLFELIGTLKLFLFHFNRRK